MPTRLELRAPAAVVPPANDFWRSPSANGSVPDGVNDVNETISHAGKVGVGNIGASNPPTSMLDVANGSRSGTHTQQPGDGAYITSTTIAYARNAFVPQADTVGANLRTRGSGGGTGLSFFGNGIQMDSRSAANVPTTFMLGSNHPNVSHALGWPDWNANGVSVRDKIVSTIPGDGDAWVDRYQAGAVYGEHYIQQAAAYRPGDQRQALYKLLLAQTGGGFGLREALRIAPVAGANGNPHATNIYNSFSHYLNPVANNAILANIVLHMAPGVLGVGADTTNLWTGIGTVAGPQGGTHAMVFTSGRVNGPHHFIGEPSRANNISGTATAAQQSILSLWDDGTRSRARFGLGLPTGATQPAGLASGELWADTSGVVHVVP